jgi:hypothetical protein
MRTAHFLWIQKKTKTCQLNRLATI